MKAARQIERTLNVHGFAAHTFQSIEDFLARANLREAACLVLDINVNEASAPLRPAGEIGSCWTFLSSRFVEWTAAATASTAAAVTVTDSEATA